MARCGLIIRLRPGIACILYRVDRQQEYVDFVKHTSQQAGMPVTPDPHAFVNVFAFVLVREMPLNYSTDQLAEKFRPNKKISYLDILAGCGLVAVQKHRGARGRSRSL
jgi:hypothetical protein